jgi:misacylated tRNA(Ala) deacylase
MKTVDPRMHTAEHILNQAVDRLLECGRCFSAHIERRKSKCDYHFQRPLEATEIHALEAEVNRVIALDLPVAWHAETRAAAETRFDLGRLPAASGDTVRVVSVGDYDACPCAGPHVTRTGLLGHFRLTGSDHREGVLRLRFKLDPPA